MDAATDKCGPVSPRSPQETSAETNKRSEERVEQHILKISVFLACFFTILGVVWGVLARSQMIVFDGLYSFISVILSSISVYAAWNMKIGDDARFPLGRSSLEPIVIVLKSIVIVVLCVTAFSKAVISLFSVGQDINTLSAMVYGIVATSTCLGSFLYIVWKRKKARASILVKAECMQWGMDTLLSAAVLLGFVATLIIQHIGYGQYARYMDPVMVVIASVFFIKMPLMSLIEGIKDMLRMAPDGDVYRASKQMLEKIAKKRGFDGFSLKIGKAGREFTYKIGFVTENPKDARPLEELDSIRQEVESGLHALYDNPIWLGVSFMHDKKWG
jgi:predicted Co/Zn/Cd cation transporter (cation efflux family)